MANYTDNLHLILPLGSKYWNLDTWNENMKILDKAFLDIEEFIYTSFTAENTTVSNAQLESTNMQDAIGELNEMNRPLRIFDITENCTIHIPAEEHSYVILNFGETVYNVRFKKTPSDSEREFVWINGEPEFEADTTYEISFLYLSAIWAKRDSTTE